MAWSFAAPDIIIMSYLQLLFWTVSLVDHVYRCDVQRPPVPLAGPFAELLEVPFPANPSFMWPFSVCAVLPLELLPFMASTSGFSLGLCRSSILILLSV